MDFTMEQIAKAMKASSAEELLAMAKEDGIELTLSEAEEYYSQLHENFEMTDNDLQMVAGGKGTPPAKYNVGQKIYYVRTGVAATIIEAHYNKSLRAWEYNVRYDNMSGIVVRNQRLEEPNSHFILR